MFFKQCVTCVSTPCRGWHPHHLSAYKHISLLWADHYHISQTVWLPYTIKLRKITFNPCEPFTSAAISGWMKGLLAWFSGVCFLFCLSPNTVFCPNEPFSVLPTQTSTIRLGGTPLHGVLREEVLVHTPTHRQTDTTLVQQRRCDVASQLL